MELILTEVCEYLNNYFWEKKVSGNFTISDGAIDAIGLKEGQYFRIVGSTFNDGVHVYPAHDLKDEEFNGSVWAMAVPQAVIFHRRSLPLLPISANGRPSTEMSIPRRCLLLLPNPLQDILTPRAEAAMPMVVAISHGRMSSVEG